MGTSVAEISQQVYSAYLGAFLERPLGQHPSNAAVKAEWNHRYLGWFDADGTLIGSGLMLLRQLPRTRWWFGYFPEGPLLDWSEPATVSDALPALQRWSRGQGICMIKITPRVVVRRWSATTIRAALKNPGAATRWGDLPADETNHEAIDLARSLAAHGWIRYEPGGPGFGGTVLPTYGFELDLRNHTPADIRAGMNSQWRRNVTRSQKSGVEVEVVGPEGIPELHRLMRLSGDRAGFEPRDVTFFQRMFDAMNTDDPDMIRLYLASKNGTAHAGMLMVRCGDRASYTFGGSDEEGRDFRPSNALQWRMINDAIAEGMSTFDLRGVRDGLSADDPEVGLTAFKAGLGATATEYLGEWDYLTMPVLGRLFRAYWNRR